MIDKKCYICLEDDENTLLTNCNHYFHLDCLLKLTYPKCPSCRNDLTNFLLKYKSKKNIKNNIKCENLRLLLSCIPDYTEMDEEALLQICLDMKKYNKEQYYNKIYDIVNAYVSYESNAFQELFNRYNDDDNNKGIFIYYLDINTFMKNIIIDYKFNIIKWFKFSEFNKYPEFFVFSKGLYNKVYNQKNKYGVLVVIKDGTKLNIKSIIIENNNSNDSKLPTHKSMITSLCENENLQFINNKQNPEINYIHYLLNNSIPEIYKFEKIHDFLYSYVNYYMQNMTDPVKFEVCIFEKTDILKILSYDVFFKNEKVKYYVSNTNKYLSIKKVGHLIETFIDKNNSYFIRIITKKNKSILYNFYQAVEYITTFYGHINNDNQYELKHINKFEQENIYNNNNLFKTIDFNFIYV
jgi:hypothetical protein